MYLEDVHNEDLHPVSLTEDQKQKLVCEAISKRQTWLDMTRQYRDDALEARQLYLENRPESNVLNSKDDELDAKSRVRMPVMAQSVDATLAQQHISTYPTDEKFFKVEPLNELSKDKQLLYEDSSEKRMTLLNVMHKSKMDRMNAMLDGVSVVWHPYIRKTRRRAVYQPRKLFGIPIGKPRKSYQEQVYLEGTDFIPLNLEDWWIDPTIDDFDQANFICREWVNVEEIKHVSAYENTDDVKPFSRFLDEDDTRLQENYELMSFDVTFSEAEQSLGKTMAMLFYEWGDFYIDDELYENHVLVYSNEAVYHGLFPNPFDHGYKPYSIGSYIPLPGTLMGKSLGKDIIPLAHAFDAFLNGAIDIVNSSAGPIWTFLTSDKALVEFFGEGKVIIEPNMAFPVQSHDSLKQHTTDLQNLGVISQLMQRVKEEIRESTGGVPYATGGVSEMDTQRTATEVNTLVSGTSTRYQYIIQNYEEKLKRFGWMWFENDRQFMSEPVFVDGEPLTPDLIKQLDFDFEVIGSKTAMSQSRESAALLGIINMLPQFFQLGIFKPKGDVVEVDLNGMLQQIGRAQGARNIDDYLNVVMTQEEAQQQQPSGLEEVLNASGQINPGGAPPIMGAIPTQPGVVPIMPAA